MPISDYETVLTLAINVKSLTTQTLFLAMARVEESRIHGSLAGIYTEWIPTMQTNGPWPDIVVDMANLLVAGRLEKTKYAINDAGKAIPNPYGVDLQTQGKAMLDDIMNGRLLTLGWTRKSVIEQSFPTGSFVPVGGLVTQWGENQVVFNDYEMEGGSDNDGYFGFSR